ncbi:MAG: SdiA-regulated domain-containing protein [Nitrospinaceae bacterium]|nr:SdiA-regulated domain-containing protein [Nitrospinaceae bacterium]
MKTILTNLFIGFFLILPAEAFLVDGLKTPQSFIVDPGLGNYFISNINGNPVSRDNNGFIVKLDASGKPLFFIRGGSPQITLHAPDGLALKGNSLYVADIDSVRWFDKNNGKPRGHIDLTGIGVKRLSGLAFDGEGNLYVSDVLANAIYKIATENDHRISVFSKDNRLGNPIGMVYDSVRQRLIVVTRATGKILGIGMNGKITPVIKKIFKNLHGIAWGKEGDLLISDETAGKIYRIKKFSRTEIVRENILTPAGISFDYARNLILVPSSKGNIAFTIPR